jgi:hypothetical protein
MSMKKSWTRMLSFLEVLRSAHCSRHCSEVIGYGVEHTPLLHVGGGTGDARQHSGGGFQDDAVDATRTERW